MVIIAERFSQRHKGYNAGLVLLLVGVVLFFVGFASPSWCVITTRKKIETRSRMQTFGLNWYKEHTEYIQSIYKFYEGLWKICVKGDKYNRIPTLCHSHDDIEKIQGNEHIDFDVGTIQAVQALQSLSVVASLIAVIYYIGVNMVSLNTDRILRAGECTAFVAVFLGVIGIIVYGVKRSKHPLAAAAEKDRPEPDVHQYMSWSFYFDLVGLLVILAAAITVSIFNRPFDEISTTMICRSGQQTVMISCPGSSEMTGSNQQHTANNTTTITNTYSALSAPQLGLVEGPPPHSVKVPLSPPSWNGQRVRVM